MLGSALKALVTFPAVAIGVGLGAFILLGKIKARLGTRRERGWATEKRL